MRERQKYFHRTEETDHRGRARLRVIECEEWEIPAQSERWFNVGWILIALVPEVAIAAWAMGEPVARAVLWTLAVCLAVGGAGCLLADREVNRGRRPKRSRVIEETVEEG